LSSFTSGVLGCVLLKDRRVFVRPVECKWPVHQTSARLQAAQELDRQGVGSAARSMPMKAIAVAPVPMTR
jgi:hypothetical protein